MFKKSRITWSNRWWWKWKNWDRFDTRICPNSNDYYSPTLVTGPTPGTWCTGRMSHCDMSSGPRCPVCNVGFDSFDFETDFDDFAAWWHTSSRSAAPVAPSGSRSSQCYSSVAGLTRDSSVYIQAAGWRYYSRYSFAPGTGSTRDRWVPPYIKILVLIF